MTARLYIYMHQQLGCRFTQEWADEALDYTHGKINWDVGAYSLKAKKNDTTIIWNRT